MLTIESAKALITETFGGGIVSADMVEEAGGFVVRVLFVDPEEGVETEATVWEGEDIDGNPALYCEA